MGRCVTIDTAVYSQVVWRWPFLERFVVSTKHGRYSDGFHGRICSNQRSSYARKVSSLRDPWQLRSSTKKLKYEKIRTLGMNEWTDTSLRYRHWRMCFERLLQAFARRQPGNLFDIAAQPILEYRWIDSYSQFKVATVYTIHTQSLSWCSAGLVPNVLPRRDEGLGKPCAVDRAS